MPCTLQPWEIEIENNLARTRSGLPPTVLEELIQVKAELDAVKKIVDERTRILCSLCRHLDKNYDKGSVPVTRGGSQVVGESPEGRQGQKE